MASQSEAFKAMVKAVNSYRVAAFPGRPSWARAEALSSQPLKWLGVIDNPDSLMVTVQPASDEWRKGALVNALLYATRHQEPVAP